MITAEIQDTLASIAERHGLRLTLVFGSYARNAERPESDLDIAILFGDPVRAVDELFVVAGEMGLAVAELAPGLRVDVAAVDLADPLFLKQILTSCTAIQGGRRDLDELQIRGFKAYQDHRPYLAMEREYIRAVVEDLPMSRGPKVA